MLGVLGVNGFACGLSVNFFVPKAAFSPLLLLLLLLADAVVSVEFELLLTLTVLELLLLFTLLIICCCGVFACGGVVLDPCFC